MLGLAGLGITYASPDGLLGPVVRWMALIAMTGYAWQRKSLTAWIMLGMLAGIEIGLDFPAVGKDLDVLSKIFLKLIKTIIAPLIFATLVYGIAGHSDMKQVGRMGWKSLLYFEAVTTLALVVGLLAINFTKAGEGITPEKNTQAAPVKVAASELTAAIKDKDVKFYHGEKELNANPKGTAKQDWKEIILHTFPENIAKSVAEGQVLQIVLFSVLFALGLIMVNEEHKRPILTFCSSLSEVMFKFTNIVMYFAPLGVMGAMAATISTLGIDVFKNLIYLVLTLYGALIAFVLLVFVPIAFAIRLPIRKFVDAISEPASLAFATASSEAALASAMTRLKKFGIPEKVVSFVLPTGYTFNLDGTTLYLSLAAIFVAQAANVDLSISDQIIICLTLMLTSKGVAGVARASLVILAGTAAMFDLPEWPIAAILGVDALMDMARTSVNLVGNCLASAVIARWEKEGDF
jgi:proton glutamate symport protein